MKNKVKIMLLVLAALLLVSTLTVFAKEGIEVVTAVWRDIKIVVDGKTIEPKDALGNSTEPFIAGGTTYLPVRAVANAFNKEVSWDKNSSTVFLGEACEIPMKAVGMYNMAYNECSKLDSFKFFEKDGAGYVQCTPKSNKRDIANDPNTRTYYNDFVTYSTNGLAKTVSGDFYMTGQHNGEGVLKIYNQNDELLYTSPIIRPITVPQHFEVDISNEIAIKIMFETNLAEYYHDVKLFVKDLTLVTSDY